MDISKLNNRQSEDYRKNTIQFGYLYAKGYITFGQALVYILTKSILALITALVITDSFLSSFSIEFKQALVDLFSHWNMIGIASYLDFYGNPSFILSLLPVVIILVWHFIGFLSGNQKVLDRKELNQFR